MTQAAPAVAKPGQQAGLADWLRYADELVRTQQYEYLGKGKVIVLEASKGANVPGVGETAKVGVRLDWRNDTPPQGGVRENFIRLAQSLDHQMILALDPVVRHDGQIGLPDIPDPQWKPRNPTPEETEAGWFGADPTMIPQRLEDRASGRVEKTNLLVFQPVHQVLFQPEINGQLAATYWTLECGHEPASGTQMAFLVDAKTGRAYFYGGRYLLNVVG